MSKAKQNDIKPNSVLNKKKDHKKSSKFEGLGYYIPDGYTKTQVEQLFKQWNEKLKKSGHKEIERFSRLGQSSSYFVEPKNGPQTQISNYNIQIYFDLIQTYMNFYFESPEARTRYKKNYHYFKLILQLHVDGVGLTSIVERLKSIETYKAYLSREIDRQVFNKNKDRSKFYIYTQLRKILNHCWLWHCVNINGELSFKDLELYNFLGLDVPNTNVYINKILASQGLSPIKLRIAESKLYTKDDCVKLDSKDFSRPIEL